MKEFKELPAIIKEHFPISRQRKPKKRWVIAQSKGTNKAQEMRNSNCEAAYQRIITVVKTLYIKPNEVYFERNYKYAETQNILAIHCLMTPTCYLYLECDFCYDFQVEYAFENCSFEAEIRSMLAVFPLDTQAKQKDMQPNFKTFYETVLKVQDRQFIGTLTSQTQSIKTR